MKVKCKFCGTEIDVPNFLRPQTNEFSCGGCTAYCTKICELGKSGKTQGWHYEPCLSCTRNPYKAETV